LLVNNYSLSISAGEAQILGFLDTNIDHGIVP
jgi:hypothetical protein